jgi:hypothetical protein
MTHDDVIRAMCCMGRPCSRPDACVVMDKSRSHLVDLHSAASAVAEMHAKAVHEACAATVTAIQQAWRDRGSHVP